MADVRALLAAEKQSRRIVHPHLTYSKSGALTCNVCNLNIKSEQLWPGHVKSLNHRKNVQKTSIEPARPAKRKIESVETNDDDERNYEVDSRKKPKPAPAPQPEPEPEVFEPVPEEITTPEPIQTEPAQPLAAQGNAVAQSQEQVPARPKPSENVDEDEWAAFEREVAPLAQQDYTSAIIEAAPVSAAEAAVAAQQKTNTVQQREDEAEAEKEDESRRMEEEFEVMEEMEDRIKRLRARREALRSQDPMSNVAAPSISLELPNDAIQQATTTHDEEASSDEDEEEVDDWYG